LTTKIKLSGKNVTVPLCSPRQLSTVTVGNKTYFIDERLNQLRNVLNPSDYINIECEGFGFQDASGAEGFPDCAQCKNPEIKTACKAYTDQKIQRERDADPANPANEDKPVPMTGWKVGEQGREEVNRHMQHLIDGGYRAGKLKIEEWAETVGELGEKAQVTMNYRVVALP
jgi:hypothetical protein